VATRTDRKIPSGFDLVLARALAKNPTERYGSIRAFWEDVEMAACGLLDAVGTEVADFGERVTARIPVIQLGLDPHKRSLAGIIVCDNRGSGKRVDMAVPRPSRALPAAHRIRERTGIAGLPSSGSRVVARIHPQRGVSPVQCLPARVRPTRLPGEFDRVRIADEASPRRGARVRGLAEKAPPRRGARGFALAVVALALLATNVRSPEAEKLAEDIGQLSRSVYRSVKSMTDLPMDCSTRPCRTIGLVHRS
jgi:hypothetical protein